MHNDAHSVSVDYGDAEITFFNVKIENDGTSVWHKHAYYELHVCTSGAIDYVFEDRTVTLKRSQSLIIPPSVSHLSVSPERAKAAGLRVISFSLCQKKSDKRFFDVFHASLTKNALIPLNISELSSLDTLALRQDGNYCSVMGIMKLKELCAEFVRIVFGNILTDKQAAVYGKRELMILIDDMIYLPRVTLDDIAAATNYTKRHVSRLIKSKYGCSLGQLRRKAREVNSNE